MAILENEHGILLELAIDYPSAKDKTYIYSISEELSNSVGIGTAIIVEFGNRPAIGYVISKKEKYDIGKNIKILPVKNIIQSYSLPAELIRTAMLASKRYASPIAQMIKMMLPPGDVKKFRRRATISVDAFEKATEEEKDILYKIGKGVPLSSLENSALNKLNKKGYIDVGYELIQRTPREKKYKIADIAYRKNQSAKRITPKQAVVIDYLIANGSTEITSLRKNAGISGAVIKNMIATGILSLKELTEIDSGVVQQLSNDIDLNHEQKITYEKISRSIQKGKYGSFYVWGITGSGKTEIYRKAAEKAVNHNRSVIILVPEISLTPQLKNIFKRSFGDKLVVMHSGLHGAERLKNWFRAHSGKARVILGTRMAIFTPVKDLGLVVIDEEHENSYKQNNFPRYHACVIAKIRAKENNATLVYGSATPSLENYDKYKNGRSLLRLEKRVNDTPLPEIQIVDMRHETEKSVFSEKLINEIKKNLNSDNKVMLFLNRRGFSRYLTCIECGYVSICPNCSISLAYHKKNLLMCHYCDYRISAIESCPKCHGYKITYKGTGTQRIEEELGNIFPGVSIIRMDSDTTGRAGSHERILEDFDKSKNSILLGTQMIAKGLHFPEVSLVGIISADTILNMPDFRAAERTFQLLIQMSGRCGRGNVKGKVIVQTYLPAHYAISNFAENTIEEFYENELQIRKEAGYPPFKEVVNVIFSSSQPVVAKETAIKFVEMFTDANKIGNVDILGPAPSPIYKLQGYYRWHILIKLTNCLEDVVNICYFLMLKLKRNDVKIILDVDPGWLL